MEREEFLIKRAKELAKAAYQRGIVTFTDFLNLNELHIVNSQNYRELGVSLETFGGYEFAERQIAAFLSDALLFGWNYPICCLKIQPKSQKFRDSLTHRDYLGSLLGLGIERSTIGDILVDEDGAFVFCLERIAPFLLENLIQVKKTSVTVTKIEHQEELPSPKVQTLVKTVASVRLDSLIAAAFQESRSSLKGLIEGGQMFVNGKLITSNGYRLREGDIISVRKKGKFRYSGISRETKKGRFSVTLERYI